MADLYVLDTHTLLWYIADDSRLGYRAGVILDDQNARLLLPTIALAEALFILERKPQLYKVTTNVLLQRLNSDPRIRIIALDYNTVVETLQYQNIREMHDRQIVATAFLAQTNGAQVAILTKDENIQNSGLVQTIW